MADVAGIVGVSVACGIFGALLAYTRDQRDKALDRVAQLEEERAARESSVDIGEPLVKAADAASADKIARDHNRFVARLLELLSENKRLRSHLERLRGWFVQQETRQLLYASEIDLADEPVMPLAEWIGTQR